MYRPTRLWGLDLFEAFVERQCPRQGPFMRLISGSFTTIRNHLQSGFLAAPRFGHLAIKTIDGYYSSWRRISPMDGFGEFELTESLKPPHDHWNLCAIKINS